MAAKTYAHRVQLEIGFDEAVERTVHELSERGFSVITWIDLRDKLIERLGADFRSYVIMGVFDPELAQGALEEALDVGLVLPVNVIVYESGPGHSVVAALAPEAAFYVLGDNPELDKLARDADRRIQTAVKSLQSS